MDKQEKQQIRLKVWQKLKNVALPDSRFHLNFAEYIPDFKDSKIAHDKIIKSEEYKKSNLLLLNYFLPLISERSPLRVTGAQSEFVKSARVTPSRA